MFTAALPLRTRCLVSGCRKCTVVFCRELPENKDLPDNTFVCRKQLITKDKRFKGLPADMIPADSESEAKSDVGAAAGVGATGTTGGEPDAGAAAAPKKARKGSLVCLGEKVASLSEKVDTQADAIGVLEQHCAWLRARVTQLEAEPEGSVSQSSAASDCSSDK